MTSFPFGPSCDSRFDRFRLRLMRDPVEASAFFGLSLRESQLLDGITRGLTVEQTAEEMRVSTSTARTYKKRCIEKMEVSSITTAVALYAAYCGGAEVTRRPIGE